MTIQDTTSNALPPSALINAITAMVQVKQPVFTWGPPGVGKSQIHAQVAQTLGLDFLDLRAVLLDAVDLRGLPHVNGDGHAQWAIPEFLPHDGDGLLFIDELPQAPQLVQNGLSSLILDRRLGEYVMPDGWAICAAGNRETDRAATVRMPSHIANRFVHLEFAIDNDDWSRYALGAAFRPEVVAFIRFRPELLHAFDPKSQSKAFPTPRSWEFVSRILNANPSKDIEYALYAGTVGEGAAAEFTGFLKVFRSLPNPDAVLLDPANAAIPNDPATLYALCGALARKADDANFDRVYEYAHRLPDEFTVLMMTDCVRRDKDLQTTQAFIRFGAQYSGVII